MPHLQGCHASGHPRPRPPDVRTRPTIPRTSALAAVRRLSAATTDVRTRPTIPRTSALAAVRRLSAATTDGRRGPTALRLPEGVAVRRPPGPSSKAVRRRRTTAPSAGGRPQLLSTGSRPPPPSIWGRPPAPSALYDSNFSFLHYVFASLIAVT
jgi:hypothetical protein